MYHDFYKLHALPFENSPDPRFFFASEQHREALAAIEYTIRMRKGLVLVTGEIGSGKTTVGRTMCQRCQDTAAIVHVSHAQQDRVGLVRQILRALDVPMRRDDDHARLLERLQAQLTDQSQGARPTVLFVDEAQTLSDDSLEELRLISNFDSINGKLAQIALIGQPELLQRLARPRHAALRQRIVLAKHLRPLSRSDAGAYIAHRIRSASVDPAGPAVAFAEPAVERIYTFTRGVPRLLNLVCDNCLLLAFVREARQVSEDIVRRVIQDMVPHLEAPAPLIETRTADSARTNNLSLAGTY